METTQAEDPGAREDWMYTLWEGIVTQALGQPYAWPNWLERPAIGRITANSPSTLRPFAKLNHGKGYGEQVKPFNFLLTAHVAPLGHPEDVDPALFQLVAPFEADSRRWMNVRWVNRYDASGTSYRITTAHSAHATRGVAQVRSYRDVLEEYRHHPEAKSLGSDGKVCNRRTVGLLRRRLVTAAWVTHVGKESNQLEEVEAGLVHDPDDVYTEYPHPAHDAWRTLVLPTLNEMTRTEIERYTGMSRTQITAVRNGRAQPTAQHRGALIRAAGAFARERLRNQGIKAGLGDFVACASYQHWRCGQVSRHRS